MKRNKNSLYMSILGLVLFLSIGGVWFYKGFLLMAESETTNNIKFMANEKLQSYVGTYEFFEYYPPNINMDYRIKIYEENENFYALININGFQTLIRFKAKVVIKNNGVALILEEKLDGDLSSDVYIKGDELLSFSKKDSKTITTWGKIKPTLKENINNPYTFVYQSEQETYKTQGDGSVVLLKD